MAEDNTAEERRKKNQPEPGRDSRSSPPQPEPILPPLIIDGPEPVPHPHS